MFHTSFNFYNNNKLFNKNIKKQDKEKEKDKDKNKFLINIGKNTIKKSIYKNEIKENCSFVSRSNQMSNYISPINKKNKKIINISNKKQNKSNIGYNNISRAFNHKKCSSMKYIDNNSNSLNIEINYRKKNNVNKSYEEIKRKRDKSEKSDKKQYLATCKKNNKRKLINLSFKSQKKKLNSVGNSNYNSNYSLNKNIICLKKYKGPIDLRNIAVGNSGTDICDEIEKIIKNKNIRIHRVNPYKLLCWKNKELIEINIYLLFEDTKNINKKNYMNDINNSINIINFDSNDLEDNFKYNNTFNGFYSSKESNKSNDGHFKNSLKKNIYYINILSQKDKMNGNKNTFELINKLIYNTFSLSKYNKQC